jgi:DNA-binding NtrC family response regulator
MNEGQTETFDDSPYALGPESLRQVAYLFVVLECDRPLAGGARYALDDVSQIEIGRGNERAGRLADGRLRVSVPGRSMSATHARLTRLDGAWQLEDAGSTNGSFVNGAPVTSCRLRDGDVLELGHTLFILREALPSPAATLPLFDVLEHNAPHPALATLLPQLSRDFVTLARVARSDLPVLLAGETGTGKEVTARAVHTLSRRSGSFVAVNCGALAPNLIESLLFGHTKGAFSGAHRDEVGFVRLAHQGTLLLDEIGDLPLPAQATLLRVLQEREVVPVGSARPIPVDARVIAATHRDLETLIAADRFRGDLLSRLDGYRTSLPPLSERLEDLGLLVAEVLRGLNEGDRIRLTPAAGTALLLHTWPFNVRELVQLLKRALVLSENGVLQKDHMIAARGPHDADSRGEPGTPMEARVLSPEDAKLREELVLKLAEHDGNIADVARAMGKARMQIHRWLKRLGLDPGVFRLQSKKER